MESSPTLVAKQGVTSIPLAQQDLKPISASAGERGVLKIDFSWKKFKARITEDGGSQQGPVYIVDCNLKKPHLEFKSTSDNATVGTANLHVVSIDADCTVSGQPITLKAMKRFKTEYSHLSHVFSDSSEPVRMTWSSSCGFKAWDFVCTDELQNPVAKFSSNIWATSKIGQIEFLGPKSQDDAARREIVVVGFTLFYLMLYRMNNIFSLFGAIVSRPGHDEGKDQDSINSDLAMQAMKKDKAAPK